MVVRSIIIVYSCEFHPPSATKLYLLAHLCLHWAKGMGSRRYFLFMLPRLREELCSCSCTRKSSTSRIPTALWNLYTRNVSHIFGCLSSFLRLWGPSFSCSSQTMCLLMDFSNCLIHCWISVVWKGYLIPSWACQSSSAATETLLRIAWMWQAIYMLLEKTCIHFWSEFHVTVWLLDYRYFRAKTCFWFLCKIEWTLVTKSRKWQRFWYTDSLGNHLWKPKIQRHSSGIPL